jgi:hypothetical protein
MRKILLAATALAVLGAMSVSSNAAIIQNLGLDPTSATGNFSNSLGTSTAPFDDQYTFTLDHPFTLTIAAVTNVFPNPTDFITGFTASVFAGTPATPGGVVLGPAFAQIGCLGSLQCQFISGQAFLPAGSFFLDVSGTANGTSGYGGNIATLAVPGPIVGAGLPGLLGLLGFGGWSWKRRKQAAA